MVIHTEVSAALYCPACGELNTIRLNRFMPRSAPWQPLFCNCGQLIGYLRRLKEHLWLLKLPCALCDQTHFVFLDERLLRTSTTIERIVCPDYFVELGFYGAAAAMADYIHKQQYDYSRLLLERGDIVDPRVMLAAYNRVNDMVAAGHILCCGQSDIMVTIAPGALVLRCSQCGRSIRITLRSGNDVFSLRQRKAIVLTDSTLQG